MATDNFHHGDGSDDFEDRIVALLRANDAPLEPSVRGRLEAARVAALRQRSGAVTARTFRVPGFWLPAAVLAASAMLAVAVWIARPQDANTVAAADSRLIEDSELLAANEEPELFSEDDDFYEWVSVADNRGG
jgi:hypothetical protein